MQLATPPRLVHGDFPHLCPGTGCAVCTYVALKRFRAAERDARDDRRPDLEADRYRYAISQPGRYKGGSC